MLCYQQLPYIYRASSNKNNQQIQFNGYFLMRARSPVPRIGSSRREVLISSPQTHQVPQREYLMRDQRTQSTITKIAAPKYTQIRLQMPQNPQNPQKHEAELSVYEEKHRIMRDYSHRDINNHEFQIELLRNENKQQQSQIQDLISELEKWHNKCQELEVSANPQQLDELKVFKRVYQCAQQDVQDLQYENEHYKRLVNIQQEELSHLQRNQETHEQKVSSLQTEIDKQGLIRQGEIKGLQDQIAETTAQFELQIRVREDIMEERNREISNLRRQLLQQETTLKDRTLLAEQRERLEHKNGTLREDRKTLAFEVTQLQQELKCTKEQYALKDDQYKKLMQQNAQLHLLIKELERNVEELQQEIDNLQDQAAIQEDKRHEQEESINSQNFELQCLRNDLSHQQELNNQLLEQLRSLSESKQLILAQFEECQRELTLLNEEQVKAQSSIKQNETLLEEFHDKLKASNENYNFLRCQLEQTVTQLKCANEAGEQYKLQHIQLLSQIGELEGNVTRKQGELNQKGEQIQQLEITLQNAQRSVTQLTQVKNQQTSDLKVLNAQLDSVKIQLEQAKTDRLQFQLQLKESEQLASQLQREKRETNQQLEHQRQELNELNNAIQSLENDSQDKAIFHKNELDSWKEKFININREFHKTQENLMMMTAEYDAVKQRKQGYLIKQENNENRRSVRERNPLQEQN